MFGYRETLLVLDWNLYFFAPYVLSDVLIEALYYVYDLQILWSKVDVEYSYFKHNVKNKQRINDTLWGQI